MNTKKIAKFLFLMSLGFIAYSLGLWALNLYYDPLSPYRYLLIPLPVLPVFYVIFVSIRAVSLCDEREKRIATEAMAFSGLATGLTCFCYFFFRDMGAPEFKAYWGWSLMAIYYVMGMVMFRRRYR